MIVFKLKFKNLVFLYAFDQMSKLKSIFNKKINILFLPKIKSSYGLGTIYNITIVYVTCSNEIIVINKIE